MTVGPYVLQSILMALEGWLLDFARKKPKQLDALLVDILRRSDSATVAAVVASVATAHPHAAGEALLVLLSVPDYIEIDRSRMAGEQQMSGLSGLIPTLRNDHQIYEAERKQSSMLPHRRYDLEAAIANLQLGPFAPRVHALLDKHLAALPPKEEQDKSDLTWRLAMHRMDFRQYTVSEAPAPEIPTAEEKPGEPPRRYVRLEPKPPDADVQAMVDEGTARFAAMNTRLGVLVWGLQAFNREDGKFDPAQWAAKLAEARAMDREHEKQDGSHHGPGFVAAVCIRDHWDEMSADEQAWCVDVVCSEVMRHADQWNEVVREQRNSMAADRASAFVLAALLGKALPEPEMLRVRQAFAAALVHPVDEVRFYMAWSVDERIWGADRALALRCVNAIATEAGLIDEAWAAEENRPYGERGQLRDITVNAATVVRQRFWQDGAIAESAHRTLDISQDFGADATKRILVILSRVPQDPLAIAAFTRASNTLVDWWKSDDDRGQRHDRNFHTEADISQRLQEFLLRTTPEAAREVLVSVLGAIDRCSRELQPIMQGLTGIQGGNPNTPQYWFLWELFAEAVKHAKWVSHLGDEHPDGSELLSAVFLTAFWKDNIRHWRFLDGYAHLVDGLFQALPPTSIVLDDYLRFLYHIGERSLPEAFVRIAAALRRGNAQEMLEKTNTVFLLEVLLQRYVYSRPLELKRDARLRDAVLLILDSLIETGSSAAFRMRDDFVTPAA